ncbi:ribosome maturation factor RimP [Limoniibacter endophyticus]|uniref:Ribosome maturation factor RimP n=1 Tax=Limoniibacter endophyticus TaxID=1565040 RepID=A0A8J3GH64_9HYPH|nr:ribosome maturation factor RimP [Limoniibacter endophyticus]GHC69856.1 ribosome maturation factor RimP [Limoniibacter endophyticus]
MSENERGYKDDRIVRESGVDARVAAIVGPVVAATGYRLVRVRLSHREGLTLQIMAERSDGTMDVEGCEAVSMAVSPALDVEDPIDKAYNLEVSSPGIDRPLVRRSDFSDWKGHEARVETSVLVDGRKRYRGRIVDAGAESFTLDEGGEHGVSTLAYDSIAEARLVLTDELIREALRKDKKLRKQAKKGVDTDDFDDLEVHDEDDDLDGFDEAANDNKD